MTDYIDRHAAIAYAISGRIRTLPTSEDGENWIRTAEVRQSLLNVPSAEVEPVKRGRWVKMSDINGYYYACSECGEELFREWVFNREFDVVPHLRSIDKTPYCPKCGAKMEGVEE